MSGDHFLNLQAGTIVNGRYEVVKCLGAGSMGMVYCCRHRELSGRLVAMKVLYPEVANDETAKIRFENEIFASYEVNHPNVVRAYEYFHDGDLIAFTMEYIGGGDLADRVGAGEMIPVQKIVRMLSQMCSGVEAIHQAGIVHRDLKPENILLTVNDDIKITDFGIARTGVVRGLTEHGGVVGTIDYVSPEYLEKGQVDARSDIYALGVLAYEMVTLVSPFRGDSVIETMTMRLKSDAVPPAEIREDCPLELSNIIMKALARYPEDRYQSGKEMFTDLRALDGGDIDEIPSSSSQIVQVDVPPEPQPASVKERRKTDNFGQVGSEQVDVPLDEENRASTNEFPNVPSEELDEQEDDVNGTQEMEPQDGVNIGQGSVSHGVMQDIASHHDYGRSSSIFQLLGWILISMLGFGAGVFVLYNFQEELLGVSLTDDYEYVGEAPAEFQE